jgi:hypothetical protein
VMLGFLKCKARIFGLVTDASVVVTMVVGRKDPPEEGCSTEIEFIFMVGFLTLHAFNVTGIATAKMTIMMTKIAIPIQ